MALTTDQTAKYSSRAHQRDGGIQAGIRGTEEVLHHQDVDVADDDLSDEEDDGLPGFADRRGYDPRQPDREARWRCRAAGKPRSPNRKSPPPRPARRIPCSMSTMAPTNLMIASAAMFQLRAAEAAGALQSAALHSQRNIDGQTRPPAE